MPAQDLSVLPLDADIIGLYIKRPAYRARRDVA